MLEIKGIHVNYGMIEAVKGVDITIKDGQIVALIGANGAGKTTIMHTISGLIKPNKGEIILNGTNLNKISADKIVKLGIVQVPEGRHVFTSMTVLENLQMGAFIRKDKEAIDKDFKKVFDLFPRLLERKDQLAGTLSGGEQQMLAMARSLMSDPKILLMDEPSMGLSPLLVKEIFSIITDINKLGVTIFLVEQNANMALQIADEASVLENGRIVLQGKASDLAKSEDVKKAYLGG